MTMAEKTWLMRSDEAVRAPNIPSGVEYHRVYVGEKRRIIRGVAAIVLLFVGLVVLAQLCLAGASLIDNRLLKRTGFTPLQHAAGALSLALLIPYSMLLQRLFYGIPAGSLHSIAGRFRYAVFGRSLLAFGPFIVVIMSIGFLIPEKTITWTTADLVAFFLISMLLIPLAAAGEEYGVRGFMFRIVGSWTKGPISGAALGVIVTTAVFSFFHGTLDPYLLGSYLLLFSTLAIITWRTGGLEVAVMLHSVYNLSALILSATLHQNLGAALSGRGQAVGSFINLLPGAVLVTITAAIWWSTRKGGPARTPTERLVPHNAPASRLREPVRIERQ